jgi:high-affinity K+ transport system ATPase subunit B
MNFRLTVIKVVLAILIGLESAFYFRDNCLNCNTPEIAIGIIIGFIPVFLWVYGTISLIQVYEHRTKFWYYLVAVPFVIIVPLAIGILLENYFHI